MKQFSEFLPIALFAGVYFYTRDIFVSTGVLMLAVCLQVGIEYGRTRSVSKQNQFILGSVVVLGGATLLFRDQAFIQWKPTVVNWIFCIVLLFAQFFSKENLLKKMLGKEIQLEDNVWRTLTLGWSFGFFLAGVLNLVVAYNFDMDFWVSYKLFGGFGLTLCYIVIMMIYLVKGGHIKLEEETPETAVKQDME